MSPSIRPREKTRKHAPVTFLLWCRGGRCTSPTTRTSKQRRDVSFSLMKKHGDGSWSSGGETLRQGATFTVRCLSGTSTFLAACSDSIENPHCSCILIPSGSGVRAGCEMTVKRVRKAVIASSWLLLLYNKPQCVLTPVSQVPPSRPLSATAQTTRSVDK